MILAGLGIIKPAHTNNAQLAIGPSNAPRLLTQPTNVAARGWRAGPTALTLQRVGPS